MSLKNFHIKEKQDLSVVLNGLARKDSAAIEFEDNLANNFFSFDQNLVLSEKKIILPTGSLKHLRAAADLAACYLLFHDKRVHQQKKFDKDEQKIFDESEKIRLICKVKDCYRGSAANLLRKIEDDIVFNPSANFSLLLLKEFFPEKILPKTGSFISGLEKKLDKRVQKRIKNLAKKIDDQIGFAKEVELIIAMMRQESELGKGEEKANNQKKSEDGSNSFGQENQENVDAQKEENFSDDESEKEGLGSEIKEAEKIAKPKDENASGQEITISAQQVSRNEEVEFKNPYKIFTSQFDKIIFPQKLVAKSELENLRDQLDLRLTKLGTISRKMGLKLKRKLLSKQNSFLEFDSSGGVLDRKKLTRLVINPMITDIWINRKAHKYQNTVLTILLDNSGSMRGNPIVMSAMACEMIAQILEKFSVKTEIIGFTTADWKGGRARKLWESVGRPKNPGRLNELRHVVYKHFNQSFKKAKVNLGLMLKEGILKENIDGEALLFARSRLMQQSEKRKILIVISDGTPVDDSSIAANDGAILSDHLHHVINKIEKSSHLEIVGIGIGHSTEEFYRNSIVIKNVEELGDAMIEKIVDLL